MTERHYDQATGRWIDIPPDPIAELRNAIRFHADRAAAHRDNARDWRNRGRFVEAARCHENWRYHAEQERRCREALNDMLIERFDAHINKMLEEQAS